MPPLHRRVGPALLLTLLLAACDQDAAQLVKQINDARQGCTQEALQAGDTACVRMMQEYAKMGTEFMKSYIGAMQTLDKTLDGMPAANFDTTGLGHALSRPAGSYAAPGDSSTWASPGLAPGAPSFDRSDPGGYYADPQNDYAPAPSGYDRSPAWGDVTSDPRGYDRRARDPEPPASRGWGGYQDEYRTPTAPAPRQRGLLRPPSERLSRPWLRSGSGYDDYSRSYDPRAYDPRYSDPRNYDPRYDPRYDSRRYPVDPRDTLGRYLPPRGGTGW